MNAKILFSIKDGHLLPAKRVFDLCTALRMNGGLYKRSEGTDEFGGEVVVMRVAG